MPRWAMSVIGFFGGALAFVQFNLSPDAPEWIRLVVGAILAGLSPFLGITHQGIQRKNGKTDGSK